MMLPLILQILAAAVLATLAIQIGLESVRGGPGDWSKILGRFRGGHGELAKLANIRRIARADRQGISDLRSAVGGLRGSWTIYKNTAVLVDAVDFLRSRCISEPRVAERLRQARVQARRAQFMSGFILLSAVVGPFKFSALLSSVAAYLSAVQVLSRVIEEFFPNLLGKYRYFVTRECGFVAAEPLREQCFTQASQGSGNVWQHNP